MALVMLYIGLAVGLPLGMGLMALLWGNQPRQLANRSPGEVFRMAAREKRLRWMN